ncbi:hypothetical protein, partial [Clostridium sp.]|uniref:hypothetical protein n=1 Tax=Clostridium sp. TaxID=1506 RepID=UPI00307F6DD7
RHVQTSLSCYYLYTKTRVLSTDFPKNAHKWAVFFLVFSARTQTPDKLNHFPDTSMNRAQIQAQNPVSTLPQLHA